jgi:hypothetical protein
METQQSSYETEKMIASDAQLLNNVSQDGPVENIIDNENNVLESFEPQGEAEGADGEYGGEMVPNLDSDMNPDEVNKILNAYNDNPKPSGIFTGTNIKIILFLLVLILLCVLVYKYNPGGIMSKIMSSPVSAASDISN